MATTVDQKEAEYLSLLESLSAEERSLLINELKKIKEQSSMTCISSEDALAAKIAGRTFTLEEKIKLEIESLFRNFQHRRELLKGALTAPEVASLLGTSRQTPHDRLKNQTLIGMPDNGMIRFPYWQFSPKGPDGVIEGLPQVLKTLKVSNFAKINWLVRPNPYLDGLIPIEALKQGQIERVIQEAAGVGEL